MLPLYEGVLILKKKYRRKYAENYDDELMDDTSWDNSLSLAKTSTNDFFTDLLREKRSFKYNLKSKLTVRKWNNTTNTDDYHPVYLRSRPIIVTNQRF